MGNEKPRKPPNPRALGPNVPPLWEVSDVAAIQALVRGEADADAQQRALRWILQQASGIEEHQYYPTDRDTAFSLGRRFVGEQIRKLSVLDLAILRKRNG